MWIMLCFILVVCVGRHAWLYVYQVVCVTILTHGQLHSCQDMLSTQLESAVIELLSQFISNDFAEIDKLKESFETAWQGMYIQSRALVTRELRESMRFFSNSSRSFDHIHATCWEGIIHEPGPLYAHRVVVG